MCTSEWVRVPECMSMCICVCACVCVCARVCVCGCVLSNVWDTNLELN